MAFLEIRHLKKAYGAHQVVHDFDIAVEKGEFISFLGPSGCGKTTNLRMVAGLEEPSSGTIHIAGREVTHVPASRRDIGMVFQSYALFPNMTVADNIAFGLKVARKPGAEVRARVDEMLGMIKLPHLATRYPFQLSGGQQQRVALARAIATKPQLLLLDEPLSALDAKIRVSLREEIRNLQRSLGITTIFVTHDQEEALSMSDRIVVMSEGRVEQLGTPFEIYNRPRTRFVASFVGTLNLLDARVTDAGAGLVTVGGQVLRAAEASVVPDGAACTVALRPEALTIGAPVAGQSQIVGTVADVSFLGALVRIRVGFGGQTVLLDTFNSPVEPPPAPGAAVTVNVPPNGVRILEPAAAAA